MTTEQLARLPKYVREHIESLQREIARRDALVAAHALLSDRQREWFTVPNNAGGDMKLWLLFPDHPFPVCSLGAGDTLLVGRAS